MAVPNAPAGPRSFPSTQAVTGNGEREIVQSVPNGPDGTFVAAINPSLSGEREIVQSVSNAPNSAAPSAVNPSLSGEREIVQSVSNAPLSQLPSTTSARINWTPNTGPQAAVRATTPVATRTAGILAADGSVVAGSGGPPYVSGNVTVGENQVGTNVILTPPIE